MLKATHYHKPGEERIVIADAEDGILATYDPKDDSITWGPRGPEALVREFYKQQIAALCAKVQNG